MSLDFAALQSKLFEHGLPNLLIFEAFTRIGNSRIDRFKNAREQAMQAHRSLIIKIFGLLDIATQNLIAERSKTINIDMVKVYTKLIVTEAAQALIVHKGFERIIIEIRPIGSAGVCKGIHRPVDKFNQSGQLIHRGAPLLPLLFHTTDKIEEFKILQAQLLGRIRKIESAAIV